MDRNEKSDALATTKEGKPQSGSPSAATPTLEAVLDDAVRDGIESGTVTALVLHMNPDTAIAYGKAAEERTKQEIERTSQAKEATVQSKEDTKKRWGFNIVQSIGLCVMGVGFMTDKISGMAAMGAICAIFGVDIFKAGTEGVLKLMAKRHKESEQPPAPAT